MPFWEHLPSRPFRRLVIVQCLLDHPTPHSLSGVGQWGGVGTSLFPPPSPSTPLTGCLRMSPPEDALAYHICRILRGSRAHSWWTISIGLWTEAVPFSYSHLMHVSSRELLSYWICRSLGMRLSWLFSSHQPQLPLRWFLLAMPSARAGQFAGLWPYHSCGLSSLQEAHHPSRSTCVANLGHSLLHWMHCLVHSSALARTHHPPLVEWYPSSRKSSVPIRIKSCLSKSTRALNMQNYKGRSRSIDRPLEAIA